MPIFDQGYQHWQGTLSGHAWRWLTITRQGVRVQRQNRWVRHVVLSAWMPALVLAVVLVFWGLLEQKSELVMPLLRMMGLPRELLDEPRTFRTAVWTLGYYYFFQFELFFAMILVLLVGPGLISQDVRFNAIPLYFSRPLRRLDYFVGKLAVVGVFLSAVAIVPAVLAFLLGILFSLDFTVVRDTWRVLLASIGYGAVIVLSAGMLMLALSALSRNSRSVAALWVGIWFVSNVVAGVLSGIHGEAARRQATQAEMDQRVAEAFRRDWRPLVSYTANLARIGTLLLDTDSAAKRILGVFTPPGRPVPPSEVLSGPQYPWWWSAAVLAGVFGLSLWILTSRVKSLDRLR
ncbi:MAG: ABC transporter permease subunit [Planctomycetes bacterium]|nr:ABC transporter permease subunit [Planctomycetota bacterium]